MAKHPLASVHRVRMPLDAGNIAMGFVARAIQQAEPSLKFMLEALARSREFVTTTNAREINREVKDFEAAMTEWGAKNNILVCTFSLPPDTLRQPLEAPPLNLAKLIDGTAVGNAMAFMGGIFHPFPPFHRYVRLYGKDIDNPEHRRSPCLVKIAANEAGDVQGDQVPPYVEFWPHSKKEIAVAQLQRLCRSLGDMEVRLFFSPALTPEKRGAARSFI